MTEVSIKTHLIITDIHSEYDINWCGKFKDINPLLINDKPVFILISSTKRMELNTWDIKRIEEMGKHITVPKGRGAVSTDKTYVYLKEINNNEKLMCVITHNRVKRYAPMFDKVGYE